MHLILGKKTYLFTVHADWTVLVRKDIILSKLSTNRQKTIHELLKISLNLGINVYPCCTGWLTSDIRA